MDIQLHLGAHRTANTSFLHYLSENNDSLRQSGLAVWGPKQTRDGLLTGVIPVEGRRTPAEQLERAKSRIALNLAEAEASGAHTVLVTDENMIGATRRNLRDERLYAAIGERMARFFEAFDGRISSVSLSIRSQDTYWASSLAFAVARGHRLPSARVLRHLSRSTRTWRDVITDLACALPGISINVLPFETFAGVPEARLKAVTGLTEVPRRASREWLNRSPELRVLRKLINDRGGDSSFLPNGTGRWHPFNTEQVSALREAYADDFFWLRAGAEGLATLTEKTWPETKRFEPQEAKMTRGRHHGKEHRRLA
ncbi:hypothetical protein [Roseovarius rhodophyticola]|uniref:Uncharacterized protein n=1 Tax=Roseovarius rhodophyticola TaxID=3080827 RepID=A0ABZ2TFK5_9RHOB|nr:hypothetical protein [Roseovarius sp. W115]MDV2928672.1 hypothetical protein [Roseovarius sp. W115]